MACSGNYGRQGAQFIYYAKDEGEQPMPANPTGLPWSISMAGDTYDIIRADGTITCECTNRADIELICRAVNATAVGPISTERLAEIQMHVTQHNDANRWAYSAVAELLAAYRALQAENAALTARCGELEGCLGEFDESDAIDEVHGRDSTTKSLRKVAQCRCCKRNAPVPSSGFIAKFPHDADCVYYRRDALLAKPTQGEIDRQEAANREGVDFGIESKSE